ncbi:MAG TPA: potassium transporter TrkG [Candidatus Hydrothermia bacterium]|nr:potassium transporter [Candidatus Hydrothermae bacterium]MDD3648814.1 potassium transporter TrkG [Candidatus Hydrothermia bacterium]HOK23319.1 potassium transporter TrkG [Candidatus Hydrothermia bacterium]HOL24128.1 potassium transporter TrkG [Candidatus Hydrothermia bacterium]HOP31983.1 potassium transporter TrkG [Candidatus Hydrothermia bacterium]
MLLFLGYISFALVGAVLLLLPISRTGPLGFTDAFFTSTSALCVTGLIVRDTPVFFTLFGKAVILVLIQLGGIGYMTVAGILLHRLRKSLILPEMVAHSFPELKPGFALSFARRVIVYTFTIEFFGSILLFFSFLKYFDPSLAFKHAIFQSVSAFCNAGFSTFSDSLVSFRGDIWVNLIMIFLIVCGGLGFFAVNEIRDFASSKLRSFKILNRKSEKIQGSESSGKVFRFSTHTKGVIVWTLSLIIGGFIVILLLENNRAFASFTGLEKVLASLFQSVTPRTCGFNTVDFASLAPATLMFIMLLMYIGGSPGGTAGGVKTNTFALVFLWIFHYLKGYKNVYLFKRRIPGETVGKSLIIVFLSLLLILTSIFLIFALDKSVLNSHNPVDIVFEVFSAFGTVGLSTGSRFIPYISLSADFIVPSKWIIIILMIVGKVGVLSIATYIVEKSRVEIGYPEDRYIVG